MHSFDIIVIGGGPGGLSINQWQEFHPSLINAAGANCLRCLKSAIKLYSK